MVHTEWKPSHAALEQAQLGACAYWSPGQRSHQRGEVGWGGVKRASPPIPPPPDELSTFLGHTLSGVQSFEIISDVR